MSSEIDPQVDYLASRLEARAVQRKLERSEEEDDEDIFAELEAEIENDSGAGMEGLREHGIESLRKEINKVKEMKDTGYGRYEEITDEKQVVRTSANEHCTVIHFYHNIFKRCEIMDKHLAALAPKYFSTRFIRVFVENVPWLVEKLQIKVLPCVICFIDGVSKDRIIGFEELGNSDGFSTAVLELRLSQSGVLTRPSSNVIPTMYGTSSRSRNKQGYRVRAQEDDGSDLDI